MIIQTNTQDMPKRGIDFMVSIYTDDNQIKKLSIQQNCLNFHILSRIKQVQIQTEVKKIEITFQNWTNLLHKIVYCE